MVKKVAKKSKTSGSVSKQESLKKAGSLAVIETSGSQYLVKPGDLLTLNRLNSKIGGRLDVNRLLLLVDGEAVKIGRPYLDKARVVLEVLENFKGKKIEVIKYKAKSRYRKHLGYRSQLTKVKVLEIKS